MGMHGSRAEPKQHESLEPKLRLEHVHRLVRISDGILNRSDGLRAWIAVADPREIKTERGEASSGCASSELHRKPPRAGSIDWTRIENQNARAVARRCGLSKDTCQT